MRVQMVPTHYAVGPMTAHNSHVDSIRKSASFDKVVRIMSRDGSVS